MNLLFSCEDIPGLVLAAEICEDVWVPCPPSISHAMAGATVIANCSASDETTGKDAYRRSLICGRRPVWSADISMPMQEKGNPLRIWYSADRISWRKMEPAWMESRRFSNECICADMDLERITAERRQDDNLPGSRSVSGKRRLCDCAV